MKVYVVEDDPAMREALARLLESERLPQAEAFTNAEDFVAALRPGPYGCILLDVRLPGMKGLDLQALLAQRGVRMPIIFLSAHGDIGTSVLALKHGAFDFLEKPVPGSLLIEAIRRALNAEALRRRRDEERTAAETRLAALTARERQVMALLAAGFSNKEIARALAVSHRTVEIHRSHVMHKTGSKTMSELMALAAAGGVTAQKYFYSGSAEVP